MSVSINPDEIPEYVEVITLAHMSMEIDIEHILTEDGKHSEKDLTIYLVQKYYFGIINRIDNPRPAVKQRALNQAKWMTVKRLTTDLKSLIDRSTLYALAEANESGWYHDMEYDTLIELLSSIYEGREGSDEAYDWKFIIETLLPTAKRMNIPTSELAGATLQVKKLRKLVPGARELLHRQEKELITATQAESQLKTWMAEVADKKVSYDELKDDIDVWRGKSVNRIDPATGFQIMMPGGKFWMVIPTNGDIDVSTVEQALKNRVNFKLTGYDWLLKEIVRFSKGNKDGNDTV